ncbi:MAG: NAD(P)H-hydrate dehydratase [Candidatus Aminicenantes bacterium]|nr:NAD(P)H-hydrate dehydratase [Candidatus Aminicenantes bacterium]
MKVLTAPQMRDIDRKTIEDIGIPGPVLMENAGLRVAAVVRGIVPRKERLKIVVVAGRGNNGGDGFVAARHLHNDGYRVETVLLGRVEELKGDARLNARILRNMGLAPIEAESEDRWSECRSVLRGAGAVIDAVFGTGLVRAAGGVFAAAIKDINACRGMKIALDVPSGLSSDSFQVPGPAVRADVTVALAAPKICHVLPPAENFVGKLVIADISIPQELFRDEDFRLEIVEEKTILGLYRKRPRDSHKGTYGHLLVIGGSLGKTGAAALAGKAALKTGAGLVTVAVPRSGLAAVARSMDELMTEPLPETEAKTIAPEAADRCLELCRGKDGLVLGPGLSTHPGTARFLMEFLPRVKLPLVLDADGLNILAANPDLLSVLPRPAVLTPHPGEFGRLTGRSAAEVLERRLELVAEFSGRNDVVLVLKGHRSLTASPDGRVFINSSGNPGMATGGSGDVLSGLIGGQLVQDKDVLKAAVAGVYSHGLAGDLAADTVGQKALTAGDIIRYLTRALKSLEDKASPP